MDVLEELLRSAAEDRVKPRFSAEGQIARLREFADRLKNPCPFREGDLVTPRKGSNIKGAGQPHLVISINEPFDRHGQDITGSSYALPHDMKVACFMGEVECVYYHWSGDYERYTDEAA